MRIVVLTVLVIFWSNFATGQNITDQRALQIESLHAQVVALQSHLAAVKEQADDIQSQIEDLQKPDASTANTGPVSQCELSDVAACSNEQLCARGTVGIPRQWRTTGSWLPYALEAQSRELSCRVESHGGTSHALISPSSSSECSLASVENCSTEQLCDRGTWSEPPRWYERSSSHVYSFEAQRRGLDCGVVPSCSFGAPENCTPTEQLNFGDRLYFGQGVAKNLVEANRFYRLAAEQGVAEAQINLGYAYENGLGVSQDFGESFSLYALAAEQGHPVGQYSVGSLYERGLGVEQSPEVAIQWYERAARQGEPDGMHRIGRMLYFGDGVPQDLPTALMWFHKAAEEGFMYSQTALGHAYKHGNGVERDIQEALRWFRLASRQEYLWADLEIDLIEFYPDQDNSHAFNEHERAAYCGDLYAIHAIALAYYDGITVEKDQSTALVWWNAAADLGFRNGDDWVFIGEEQLSEETKREAEEKSRELVRQIDSGEKCNLN